MSSSKKPRVLMLYDFPIKGGGSGPYVKYLALRLKEIYKYDVAVAAPDEAIVDPKIPTFHIKLPQVPVFIGRPGLEESKKYSQLTPLEIADLYHAYLKETIRIVTEYKPTVIHVHHLLINAWVARYIKSIFNIKYVVTSHGSDLFAIAKDRRYFLLTRDALRGATNITVVSGDTRAKLLRMFGTDLAKKTRTIPGGVAINLFPDQKSHASKVRIAKEFHLQDMPMVLFSGRLISEKGVEYLVKAAANIHGQILLVGDGGQKKVIADLIEKKQLTNVRLLGFVEPAKLTHLYYLADVFVSPAVWDEPLGLTILEAMASGTPVVVTRRGGIPLAVKEGYNGFFVRVRNATDIAEKVNKLLDNEKLRMRLGKNARLTVQEKFTWTKIAERFDKVYTRMVYL